MAKIEFDPTQIFIATLLWGAVTGAIGWFANGKRSAAHDARVRKYALEDARHDRINKFRGFMSQTRSRAERNPIQLANNWDDAVHDIRRETGQIRNDVTNKSAFDKVVTDLCSMTASQVQDYGTGATGGINRTGRDRVCSAIDQIVAMLD